MNYQEFLDSIEVKPYAEKIDLTPAWYRGSSPIFRHGLNYDPIVFNIPDPKNQILTFTDWILREPPTKSDNFLGVNRYYDPITLAGIRYKTTKQDTEYGDPAELMFREGGLPSIVLVAEGLDLNISIDKYLWDEQIKMYTTDLTKVVLPKVTAPFLKPNEYMILAINSWCFMEKDGLKTLVCKNPSYNVIGVIEDETHL